VLTIPKIKEIQVEVVVMIMASIIMVIFPIRTDNISFILLALINAIYFFFKIKPKYRLSISHLDIFWGAFIILGLISFFWANDGALIWMRSFGWIVYFIWMLLIRSIMGASENEEMMKKWLIGLFMVSFLFVVSVFAFHKFDSHIPFFWENYFGNNQNTTTLHLALLLPYFLFTISDSRFKYIKLFVILMFAFILFLTTALGSTIAFSIVISSYLLDFLSKRMLKRIVGAITLAVFLVLLFNILEVFELLDISIFEAFVDNKRLQLMKVSWLLFLDNSYFGVGLGNWITEVLSFKSSGILLGDFNYGGLSRPSSHNLYTEILAELGISGFLLFVTPFIFILSKGIYQYYQLSPMRRAALISIIVYLAVLFVNRIANFYPFFFSKVQLVAFCSIGIFLAGDQQFKRVNLNVLLSVLSVICLLWFVRTKINDDKYRNVEKIIWDAPETAIDKLTDLYDPIFQTTHGVDRSIPFRIAQLYNFQGNIQEADKWYKIAISKWPYEERFLMHYTRFLLRYNLDIDIAKKNVDKLLSMHAIYYDFNPIEGELALAMGQYEKCRDFLNKRDKSEFYNFYNSNLVELKLYTSSYMDALVQLTNDQETAIAKIFNQEQEWQLDRMLLVYEDEIQRVNHDAVSNRRKEIQNFLAQKNKQFFQILTPEQYVLFLKDKNTLKYKTLLKPLIDAYGLTDAQQTEVFQFIANIESQKEDLTLRIRSDQYDNEEKSRFRKRLTDLSSKWDASFSSVLNVTQFDQYQKTKIKKTTIGKINQFNTTAKLSTDSLASVHNLIIEKIYLGALKDSTNQQKITNLEKEIQEYLNEVQYRTYQELFSDK